MDLIYFTFSLILKDQPPHDVYQEMRVTFEVENKNELLIIVT